MSELAIGLSAAASFLVAEGAKVIWRARHGNTGWKYINSYGGMPSVHTAVMTSLTTAMGLVMGLRSALFAFAVIMSLLVIRDALGIRRFISETSRATARLLESLPTAERSKYPVNEEYVGHTLAEVIVGALIGFAVALVTVGLAARWI